MLSACCQIVEVSKCFTVLERNECIWKAEWSWDEKPEREEGGVKVKNKEWMDKGGKGRTGSRQCKKGGIRSVADEEHKGTAGHELS